MSLRKAKYPYKYFPLFLIFSLILIVNNNGSMHAQDNHCGNAPRLVPNDYDANKTSYDAICLPEAWYFMQDKWQGLQPSASPWPIVVVIDDGFFATDDFDVRPELHPGYPDGTGIYPDGTAIGNFGSPGRNNNGFGNHGTAVLSLMASKANNASLIAGVSGHWSNIPGAQNWGASFIPVRWGRGDLNRHMPQLPEILSDDLFNLNEIRVVNISVDFPSRDFRGVENLEQRIQIANARQIVMVIGAGNNAGTIETTQSIHWFDNTVVVGALNQAGTDLWALTVTGPGVDLYAPGENISFVENNRVEFAEMNPRIDISTVIGSVVHQDSGTSFAAPLVSGVVAMMLNIDPTLDSWIVRDILVKTADLITSSQDGSAVPRLNAYRALLCTSTIQRASSGTSPTGREWVCGTESIGSFSGRYTPRADWRSLFTCFGGEAIPDLVSSWKVSEDGLIWTFELIGNIILADGQPLTSASIADAIRSQFSFIEVVSDRVIRIRLNKLSNNLPCELARIPIAIQLQ